MSGFGILGPMAIWMYCFTHMMLMKFEVQAEILDHTLAEFVEEPGYAIVIDAGSSGSRLYAYTYNSNGQNAQGIPDIRIMTDTHGQKVVKNVEPGISTFVEDPTGLDDHIASLLDFANNSIPELQKPQTKLYVLATGGMRMLPRRRQDSIWTQVRKIITERYPFSFQDENARTITGREEAIYGWITGNYLLGRFGYDYTLKKNLPTTGMLDMGGASVQISFEVEPTQFAPLGYTSQFSVQFPRYPMQLRYRVYAVGYLYYGADIAHDRYERYLLYKYVKANRGIYASETVTLNDPCLQNGLTMHKADVVPRMPFDHRGPQRGETNYKVVYTGTGNFEECRRTIALMLHKHYCFPFKCAVGEVSQPEIYFDLTDFYGFSNFYYGLSNLNNGEMYDYAVVTKNATVLCAKDWNTHEQEFRDKNQGKPPALVEKLLGYQKQACFKASYATTLLHDGFRFPKTYKKLHLVRKVHNRDLEWSLGALFYKLYATPEPSDWRYTKPQRYAYPAWNFFRIGNMVS